MKMNKYTIHCTQEQTEKALELDAPISNAVGMADIVKEKYFADGKGNFIILPTAEQMINWLEEQGLQIDADWSWGGQITMYVWDKAEHKHVYTYNSKSRQEATLVVIDAALDFLIKNKK